MRGRTWLFRIVICLLLGVITTVAVAWGLAIVRWPRFPETPTYHGDAVNDTTEARTETVVFERFGSTFAMVARLEASSPDQIAAWHESVRTRGAIDTHLPYWAERIRTFQVGAVGNPPVRRGMREMWATGWPWRALYLEATDVGNTGYPPMTFTGFFLIGDHPFLDRAADPWSGPNELPLLPIIPGFLCNTLFYAATFGVLFLSAGSLKRWNRTRRGLCPKCAHDLRRNPEGPSVGGCAECRWGREDDGMMG
jgi:hypothetical protein